MCYLYLKNQIIKPKLNEFEEILLEIFLNKLGTKKAIISDGLSNVAPPLGLEPRTL